MKGTNANAYISSFDDITDLTEVMLVPMEGGEPRNFLYLSLKWRTLLMPVFEVFTSEANDGELAALVSCAIAFPNGFMAVVDTYDVQRYPSRLHGAITTLSHNEYR